MTIQKRPNGVSIKIPETIRVTTDDDDLPLRHFTLDEYHQLTQIGFFTDERIELLEGLLVKMSPIHPPHAFVVNRLSRQLMRWAEQADDVAYEIRSQQPVTIPTFDSEPEPDIVIAKPNVRGYSDRHPQPEEIFLLVEVSDSTLSKDRGRKLRSYAKSNIQEYWIINLVDRQVEVYREPAIVSGNATYQTRHIYPPTAQIAPRAVAEWMIDFAEIFPTIEES
jgi:Uma2 family endonuclease